MKRTTKNKVRQLGLVSLSLGVFLITSATSVLWASADESSKEEEKVSEESAVSADSKDDTSSVASSTSASSGGSFKLDNDGKFRDAEKVYGDCGVAPSFKDVEYYDCYVPYAQTNEEIGGYAIPQMKDDRKKARGGDFINYENDMFHYQGYDYWTKWNEGGTEGYESDTQLATLTDSNGTTYYVTAFPKWLWNYSGKYYNWGFQGKGNPSAGGGEIADVILTDGTCIHFVFGDAKAEVHTNGGGTGPSPDKVEYSTFENTNLSKHPQYTNMYQAEGGEILEVWGKSGSHTNFQNKYNFQYLTGEGNHIAYVRMYNKKISDNPTPASEACKAVSYSATGGRAISGGSTGVSYSGDFLGEEDFIPINILEENRIALPTRESLSIMDKQELSAWKEDIRGNTERRTLSYQRAFVMLLGILLCVYSVCLYIAFHFDTVNNFVEIELLSVLTLGSLVVSPDGRTSTWGKGNMPQAVTHKNIIVICVVSATLGILIASGKLFSLISSVIRFVKGLLS